MADRILGFTIPGRAARGRVVRLDSTLNEILAAHAYPEPVARIVAETLVLTALLGALFREDEGQLTVQAKGEGGQLKLLVADWRLGELRGYASQDLDRRFAPLDEGRSASLEALLGKGYLAITLDQTASSERYQGIVELGRDTLEAAAQGYFENSEQLPTLVRLAAHRGADGRWSAGGMIVQHLPRAEDGAARLHVESGQEHWAHVEALASTVTPDELTDAGLSLDALLWRLFNEDEVRVLPEIAISRGCRCSVEHIRNVLGQFPEEERAEMRNADGVIAVDCEFCSKQFLLEI
ncbi:Hsp33 family molecular chaperone HslO [Sandaracinobacter neustonicus]|uniref:Hsp33 family molecular chaperone HslO n=1 Tax=Sandaracinobacter neustonicus TaxID=1715348 RepID=A0A501XNE5_9SPHN|nr:Hsp33 family molecular chaperone HslO [Sandaracinobacter neustonicus]TPE61803.1 Hsp33 family molecular chaperone HslO [Sandaracinobacter neustonicus]